MSYLHYTAPAAAFLAVVLVIVSSPARQDPQEHASSSAAHPEALDVGARDSRVEHWEKLLGHFDRGEKAEIRRHLGPRNPSSSTLDPSQAAPAAPDAGGAPPCLASRAMAFLDGADDGDATTIEGAEGIIDGLCAIWPPLTSAQNEAGHRSRIVKSFVLGDSHSGTVYLLTIERPAQDDDDETTTFFVSALAGGAEIAPSTPAPEVAAPGSQDSAAKPVEREAATLASSEAESHVWHLHVSSAN